MASHYWAAGTLVGSEGLAALLPERRHPEERACWEGVTGGLPSGGGWVHGSRLFSLYLEIPSQNAIAARAPGPLSHLR